MFGVFEFTFVRKMLLILMKVKSSISRPNDNDDRRTLPLLSIKTCSHLANREPSSQVMHYCIWACPR